MDLNLPLGWGLTTVSAGCQIFNMGKSWKIKLSMGWLWPSYPGWKKSCTTLDGWNPINTAISHLSTDAGFLPSTVCPMWGPWFLFISLHSSSDCFRSTTYLPYTSCAHGLLLLSPIVGEILNMAFGKEWACGSTWLNSTSSPCFKCSFRSSREFTMFEVAFPRYWGYSYQWFTALKTNIG